MIIQPSAKKLAAAIAFAIEDRKISSDTGYKRVMTGNGSTAQHFLYWPIFNQIAEVCHDPLGKHFYVGYAQEIERNSIMAGWLREWK